MDFMPGSLYITDDFSAYKCVDIDPENVATLVPLQSRNAGAIRISKELSFAWSGPFTSDPDGFGFDSIVRDYYSGNNYVVINDLIDDTGFKMTLVKAVHDASLVLLAENQNFILNVPGDIVAPWPDWIAQQSVPSNDMLLPGTINSGLAGLAKARTKKTDAIPKKQLRLARKP